MQLGRYLHASLILREHFATVRDTAAEDLLLAARAEAGWGNWEHVERLLSGRSWLDTLESALGWEVLGRSYLARERWKQSATAFANYLAHAGDVGAEMRGLAELRRAQAHTFAEEYADAFAAFSSARDLLPAIAPWIALRAAGTAATAGDTSRVTQWLALADPALARERAWAYQVEALREAGEPARARRVAEAASNELTGAVARARALVALGELRMDAGDVAGAREAFRRAMAVAPSTGSAVNAARALTDLSGITTEDQLAIGRVYLRHGNLARGIAGLQAYVDAGAGTDAERERLRWDIGQAQFRAGRYDDAPLSISFLSVFKTSSCSEFNFVSPICFENLSTTSA
jgi:soluble lytic murein transglycosylase